MSDDERRYWLHASGELDDTWVQDLIDDLEEYGDLTDDVIAALDRATRRASDGPWPPIFGNGPDARAGDDVAVGGRNREADAAFVGVARTAMPLLLDEVRRLREQRAAWRQDAAELSRYRQQNAEEATKQRVHLLLDEIKALRRRVDRQDDDLRGLVLAVVDARDRLRAREASSQVADLLDDALETDDE